MGVSSHSVGGFPSQPWECVPIEMTNAEKINDS